MQKNVGNYLRNRHEGSRTVMWSHQRRETPGEGEVQDSMRRKKHVF